MTVELYTALASVFVFLVFPYQRTPLESVLAGLAVALAILAVRS